MQPIPAIAKTHEGAAGWRVVSHIWTTHCLQGLFLRDGSQGLDCMHISDLSLER
jgi:hypothetical protein